MTVKTLAGLAGVAAISLLGACADEEPTTVAVATPEEPVCEPLPGVYARVADFRPVNYSGAFDPGYIAVTDTTMIGQGQPNAIQYVVTTEQGQQLPLVAREQYRRGDQLYIEADSCQRARVTVIQELG
jgi:hypothetical protein